jgi:hypothetical protein
MSEDKCLVRVHLSSGQVVTAIWAFDPGHDEAEDVEAEILALLQEHPREFISFGDTIVHTGAISAVEVVA